MSDYWIADAWERVLGPLGLETIKDLVTAGRLRGIIRISLDGKAWQPIETLPELAELQAGRQAETARRKEREEAERLKGQLEAQRRRTPGEIFGLGADAPVEAYRAAFFRLVKRYAPDALPSEAAPELRAVYSEVFGVLSRSMASVERQAAAKAPQPAPAPPPESPERRPAPASPPRPPPMIERVGRPPASAAPAPAPVLPRPAGPAPRKAAAKAGKLPTYALEEFIGVERRSEGRIAVDLRITAQTAGMFTDCKLSNFSCGGAFVPWEEPQSLGALIELAMHFDDPAKTIHARGKVTWWSAGGQTPRGFGLKFTELADGDRRFIEDYLSKPRAK